MILSGFTLGSQMTAALMNPGHISFYAPIVVLGGMVVNAASFPTSSKASRLYIFSLIIADT